MPCPVCNELAVLFRDKVIPLSRRIIEQGSFEERKAHLAGIIAEFLEDGAIPFTLEQLQGRHESPAPRYKPYQAPDPLLEEDDSTPISDEEFDKFVRIDLKCIDNAAYFKRHFSR